MEVIPVSRSVAQAESIPVSVKSVYPRRMTTARSALRADAARNRAALLKAARLALEAEGSLPPLAALARRAGVGVGTAYRHFQTVEAVLAALGEEGLRTLIATVRSAASLPDPAQGLAAAVDSVVRGALDDPGIATILEGDEGGPSPLTAELSDIVDNLLVRARAAGAVRSELGTEDIRRLVTGVIHALRNTREESTVAIYVRVLVDGIRDSSR